MFDNVKQMAEAKLERHWASYEDAIDQLALGVFASTIKPFLKRRGYRYMSGMGAWWMGDDQGYWEDDVDFKIAKMEGKDDPRA